MLRMFVFLSIFEITRSAVIVNYITLSEDYQGGIATVTARVDILLGGKLTNTENEKTAWISIHALLFSKLMQLVNC